MNKFQKLAQLNQDIELLENAGKFEAAEILQKKFVREAQRVPYSDAEAAVTNFQTYAQGGTKAPTQGVPYSDAEAAVTNFQTYAQGGTKAPTQGVPYSDSESAVTKGQQFFQGLGNAISQPQGTSGDTANEMQAKNSMPAESPIYQQAINQIANLLNTKMPENRDKAQQIYENTIGQFKDPKRKQLFAKQFQAIVSRNFPAGKLN